MTQNDVCVCRPHRRPAELPLTSDGTDSVSPTFFISESSDPTPSTPPPSSSSVVTQTGSKPVNPVSSTKPSYVQTARQPGIARSSHQASSPLTTTTSETGTLPESRQQVPVRRTSREKRGLGKMDSWSRLPSITHLQEKLRKRWPRTMRVAGSAGGGGGEGRERSPKYWKTAPRLVSTAICGHSELKPSTYNDW